MTKLQKHVHQWMAILNYSEAAFSKHTMIFDQVQQAMLLGASAVLLLAMNADVIRKLDWSSVMWPKPVYLVSSNVTKILRSLAEYVLLYCDAIYLNYYFIVFSTFCLQCNQNSCCYPRQ